MNFRSGFHAFLLVFCISLRSWASTDDEGTRTPHRVPKVHRAIVLDGVLDEDVWAKALSLMLEYEVRPSENVPPPVETEVLLAYNDTHLLAAFRAYDPEPSAIRARMTDRDRMYSDDWVVLILDTFNDERHSFDFFCNPLGVQGDGTESPTYESDEWDAIWDSKGRITEEGYIVEMSIPFSSLRFQRTEGDQVWGFDAVRSYPRSVRHHIGLFPRDRNNNCYLCQAEKLIGFAGATPGRNIEIDPTVYGVYTQERDLPGGDFKDVTKELEPGITARWGIRPNLNLNATLNPDFSNVEADAAQLDINTQFTLFYDEKRPFFLEGADFFRSRTRAVYTRTLADPVWGTKITGKEGSHGIGYFTVQDRITNLLLPGSQGSETTSLDQRSLGNVLRYRKDISRSSNLGLLLTDREGDQYHNRMAGFDGDIKFTPKDRFQFQLLGSQTSYPDSVVSEFAQKDGRLRDYAFDVFYLHDTRNYGMYARYKHVGEDFRADLGFVPRVGFRLFEVGGELVWFGDSGHWFNIIEIDANWDKTEEVDGTPIEEEVEASIVYVGPLQTVLVGFGGIRDFYYEHVKYDQGFVGFYFEIVPSATLSLGMQGRWDDHVDFTHARPGRRMTLSPWIDLKPGRRFVAETNYDFQRMTVEAGRLYTAHVLQSKLVYQFTRRLFLRTILQYVDYERNMAVYEDDVDARERNLFSQVLLSYKINPQTVFFLGYSDNHFGTPEYRLMQENRTVFVKVGYAWVI